jgi:deoxycytidylate deaminase
MNNCKRMDVYAFGIDAEGNVAISRNGNKGECKNIPGACGCIHAEELLLKKMCDPVEVHVTHSPCLNCAKLLVDAGVKKVRYLEEYRIKDGITYLDLAGVSVYQV